MRAARKLGPFALLALLVCACDTTQPLELDDQTFLVTMRGAGGEVPIFDVFDMFEDTPRCEGDSATRCTMDGDCAGTAPCLAADGVADDNDGDGEGDVYLWCKTRTQAPTTANVTSVPYGFTIEVTILRAGTTEREAVTSVAAMKDVFENVTEYDQTVLTIPGTPPAEAPITRGASTYYFINGRRLTAANIAVASATNNPLSDAAPAMYGIGAGRCSLVYYGPAVIDRAGIDQYPLMFVLGKGDTVTVKVIRAAEPFPNGVPIQNPNSIAVLATTTLDGRPVEVSGTFATDPASSSTPGFAYTFTSF